MRFRLALVIALAAMAPAQQGPSDWQTAQTLPDVNLTGLSAAQKQVALKSLRVQSCTCGCEMHVAECRMKDPNCGISKAYAGLIVKAVREGKDPEKAVTESALYKNKTEPPKLLEDAVPMSIDGAPVKGAANARITLVEYSDFECPFCSRAAAKIEAILKAYPNDARLVYKQYPLPTHPHAKLAAQAALAAQAQNKFWPMHDKLFANYNKLNEAMVVGLAKESGLDMARFEADRNSAKTKSTIEKDIADGNKVMISGTPTLFINGKRFNGALEMAALKPVLDAELKK